MTTFFALLGTAGLWVLYEIAGQLIGELLWMVLGPVLRPVVRLAGRLLSGRTVALLWIASIASYGIFPYAQDAGPLAVQTLGFVAFMGLTPLALMATFALRHRRRGRALRGLPA